MRANSSEAPALFAHIETMKKNFRTLETLGVPVVSCINGAALGGGWEVAMIGHHRIAVDDKKIQLGMPEVSLGLMPGATGITKTVRLLGLSRFDMKYSSGPSWCGDVVPCRPSAR